MLGDWIKHTSTTTGTGSLTIAAVSGFPAYGDVFAAGRVVRYAILDDAAKPIERGVGTLTNSTTLARTWPTATWVSGVLDDTAPSAASLAAGTKTVLIAAEAGAWMPAPHAMAAASGASYRKGIPTDAFTNSTAGSVAAVKDRLYYLPITLAGDEPITSVRMMNGSTTGSGGTNGWRLGLYDSLAATGGPGAKLYESGNISASAYAELVYTLASTIRLRGRFWLACVHDYSTAPTTYGVGGGTTQTPLGLEISLGPQRVTALYEALTAGWSNMPASAAASPTPVYGTTAVPTMWVGF